VKKSLIQGLTPKLAVVFVAFWVSSALTQQRSPIVDVSGPGGFTLMRQPGRPGIDGRAWAWAPVHAGVPDVVQPPGADYRLRFTEPPGDTGDFQRYTITLERTGSPAIPLTEKVGFSGFAYVSPDARYIFLEPLFVIDTKTWRRYSLHDAFDIHPYITIVAYSRDGRLFLTRRDCAIDCPKDEPEEYFELSLPR
jgi:hypothetical protein